MQRLEVFAFPLQADESATKYILETADKRDAVCYSHHHTDILSSYAALLKMNAESFYNQIAMFILFCQCSFYLFREHD